MSDHSEHVNNEPPPPLLSYGVELEMFVAYCWTGSPGENRKWNDKLPEPIFVKNPPRNGADDSSGGHVDNKDIYVREHVHTLIRDTLREYGFPADMVQAVTTPTYSEQQKWLLQSDSSLYQAEDKDNEDLKHLVFCGLEISTPVEFDSPRSFEVLRHAVNLLCAKFRILVNPTCGLHVHIGKGQDWMPLHWIKRMGALFWASDKLLASLHPPFRQVSAACPSIREYSSLAGAKGHFEFEHDLCRYIGGEVRPGERSLRWRSAHSNSDTLARFHTTRTPGRFDPFLDDDADHSHLGSSIGSEYEPEEGTTLYPAGHDHWSEGQRYPISEYTFHTKVTMQKMKKEKDKEKEADVEEEQPQDRRNRRSSSADTVIPIGLGPELREDQAAIARRIAPLEPVPDPHARARGPRLSGLPRLRKTALSGRDIWDLQDFVADQVDPDQATDGTVGPPPKRDKGAWFGVLAILAAETSCEVETLLSCHQRPNFNLRAYNCDRLSRRNGYYAGGCHPASPGVGGAEADADAGGSSGSGGGSGVGCGGLRKTVEWRQAAGSMDARWVAAWARIVVGVSRWAVWATPAAFFRVLANCARADRGEGAYDVIDMLEEMGLVAEATVAEERISKYKSEWNLLYEGESDPQEEDDDEDEDYQ
ncbi:hypothetical protein BX600DRAFT_529012 [Xylariales sp. PMI_506]|nr:hypothetical protein BX600DRAFT_529012 [Xylariales sp. PMI_506]